MSFTTKPPFVFLCGWQTTLILTKGGFLVSKDFYSHRHSRWLSDEYNQPAPRKIRIRLVETA